MKKKSVKLFRVGLSFLLMSGLSAFGMPSVDAASTVVAPNTPPLKKLHDIKKQPKDATVQRISMQEFVTLLVRSDELIRAQRLEEGIALQGVRGAEAIFEPFVTLSMEREGSHVLNSASDAMQRGVRPGDIYDARESRAKVGLASKIPTGATAELVYNLTETENSLQNLANTVSPEYKGYFGVNVNQPLLRGAGFEATKSGIAIAQIERDVAKQTVRQVMVQRLMEGLNVYIMVQRAEDRVRLRTLALEVAKKIEREVVELHLVGLQPEPEVTKARSTLALRQAQLSEAQEDLEEQLKMMQSFVTGVRGAKRSPMVASRLLPAFVSGVPKDIEQLRSISKGDHTLEQIVERRPEVKVNALRITMEEQKVKAAQDQAMPDLSLNVRAGKDEISSMNKPFQYVNEETPYHSWAVGLTFKVGIFGDEKKISDYHAENLRKEQAELTLQALRQRIVNEVNTSDYVLDKALQRLARQQEIVTAQRDLFKVMDDMHKEGSRSGLDVMRQELELLLAEEAQAEALAHAKRASYLASQVDGTLLSRLGLE